MAFTTTAKLSEIPLRNSLSLTSHSPSINLLFSPSKYSFHILRPLCFSLKATDQNPKPSHQTRALNKLSSQVESNSNQSRYVDKDRGQNAIDRIVLRLRNLGLGSDDEYEEEDDKGIGLDGQNVKPETGDEKLVDLLRREWVRPDYVLAEEVRNDDDGAALPWERSEQESYAEEGIREMKRRGKAPTLAELTIEDEELRRLRRNGMFLRERISIPKAGITQAVLEKIHDKWRKEELVRLKFHEVLAHDMKTAHEIVERRTGGLVLWRSGSVMVVYRGSNYKGPSRTQPVNGERDALFIPDVSSAENLQDGSVTSVTPRLDKSKPVARNSDFPRNMTEQEAEFNSLLDGLGPRFVEYWGTGVLPVDADLLPPKVPGYKTPFRLLPNGMRSRLTNTEITNFRKLAKSLPCHFALGRNRNHQGLATAIIKLWEKSSVVKIAVKRGIQNTNNKLMAEELKNITGGDLLLRNKYYIVMFRGKDFLPISVAAALAERQELTKQVQDVEEKVRIKVAQKVQSGPVGVVSSDVEEKMCIQVAQRVQIGSVGAVISDVDETQVPALAGTLTEFYEAQARWGREISPGEHEQMIKKDSIAKHARLVKRIEHKLAATQAKKIRAEKLLAKIEASMVPAGPDYDQEIITDEERVMFRRVGLRMKAYLPLGIRGVFDGVIENMHLHWKHRELVKLVTKQKTLAFVEDTARLLEYESGGILVAIDGISKGYAIIYYRGKNYQRPISVRPRNLLTKAKALKRSVAMQRHEALSQHLSELERTIEQMKDELDISQNVEDEASWSPENDMESEGEASFVDLNDEASDKIDFQ